MVLRLHTFSLVLGAGLALPACGALIGVDDLNFATEGAGGSGQGGGGVGGDTGPTTTAATTTTTVTSTGTGGDGGAMGSAEVCDSLDNDLDGQIDDGCPASLLLTAKTFDGHPEFGAPTGEAFESTCPEGHAMIGFTGWATSRMTAIAGICVELVLQADAPAPFSYVVRHGPLETHLPGFGDIGFGESFEVACFGNDFVVGIEVRENSTLTALNAVAIHCAPIEVEEIGGVFAPQYGPSYRLEESATGSPGPNHLDLLTAPLVVDRFRGRDDAWIDRLGIGEATLTVQVIPEP